MADEARIGGGGPYIAKCYGVIPLCLKTDATPHYHCPISMKCTFVSFEEAFVQVHVSECSVKPATVPEESYLICSKVQAFCVAGHDKAKKSPGQKHYHCAGYPECMHVSSRLSALKSHIFTCDKLAKRLDLYPVCTELACRHQYDETKFHYHCDSCEWTTENIDDVENHRAGCYVEEAQVSGSDSDSRLSNGDNERPVIVALVSNDDSVVINLQPCSKKQCMKKIDIKKEHEHYHCPACEFCAIERNEVLNHFSHIHYDSTTHVEEDVMINECYALDVSCCAEKRVEKNKTIMSPVLHYHCPQCKEFSDCTLEVVRIHYHTCNVACQSSSPLKQSNKRTKLNLVELFANTEDIITEIVQPAGQQSGNPLAPPAHVIEESMDVVKDPFDHCIIECTSTWKGCAVNRGIGLQHYHCPYCTWSSSLLVNIQAHMPGCLEKLAFKYHYDEKGDISFYDNDDYDSPVEYPIINYKSREFLNIIPCYKRIEGCSRIGLKYCYKSSKVHWHCPICTISGGKAAIEKHFQSCASSLGNDGKDINPNQKRKDMDPAALRHSDSEDSDCDFDCEFDTPESLTNVVRCYKKLPICSVDEFPGRPLHFHCAICAKPDLNRRKLEQHQVGSCLQARAKALRDKIDPNDDKFKNPPNVIVCRQREASCNTTDSKRVTHFHCSVCSYVSYRKDRAENHVQKAHLAKSFDLDSTPSPTKNSVTVFNPVNNTNDPCDEFMERCEQDIRQCKVGRKSDPRRRAHWHCNRCDFVDYKRYRIKCHVLKNHLDPDVSDMKEEPDASMEVAENISSDEEEDEVHGIFSCVNTSGTCNKSKRVSKANAAKKHWHCSLCNFWGSTKAKAFQHYVKCLRKGRKNIQNTNFMLSKSKQFLSSGSSDKRIVDMFQVPNYNRMNNSPLIFCNSNVFQCTFPLNTRIDDKGHTEHWHCPMCDKVGFLEYEGLKHYVHCSNFIDFHVKSQIPDALIDLDILQCTKDFHECAPNRKKEDRIHFHFHCPLCPYVDYLKTKVNSHYTEICAGKASSTHIMYCTAEVEKCSSGTKETKPGYFGHWHCSLCTFIDYNQRKVAAHYRDCFVINQKYGARYGYEEGSSDVHSLHPDSMEGPIIRYPDIPSLNDKELTLLKIIPCSRRLEGCESGTMDLKEQPLHYHCPICKKSDYLQLMLRHFPRCLRYLNKKRKSAGFQGVKVNYKKKKQSKSEMKKIRNEGLGCQMIDKNAGIFVVRGSAVGLGFPVHVIFKKTHPKEFHCESGCEMQDRQLCKHLSAVEKYVRENNVYKDDVDESESIDMNEDFPDLDQIDLFHRITDEEKCDVYTLHNYCLDNNTPVIRPFQTFKYPDGEETSCTFYSVCSAMFKGYFTRSGRVITTYNKKTQKYLCKCFYKECVHTTITKLYRASLGMADCHGIENQGSINMRNIGGTRAANNTSINSSSDNFLENLYDDCNDQRRFLKIVHDCDI